MISAVLPVIPYGVLPHLTPYERVLARYLADKGRIVLEGPNKPEEA